MSDLVSQSSTISNYSRSSFDKNFADKYETVLGHLVLERGYELKKALIEVAPIVKATYKDTIYARDWCQKIGFGTLGLGILVGAGMGITFAVLPVLASGVTLKLWADSREELPRREAEYHLLRTVPQSLNLLYGLASKGCDAVTLVSIYDALITAIEPRIERGESFTEVEVGEFIKTKLANSLNLDPTNQSQQGLQPSNDQELSSQKNGSLAVTELQTIAPGVAVAPSIQHITSPVWNPATDLGENPQSALIVGTPGSGKGMLVSNAVRILRANNPGLTVMMIDPKGDPKERGYWEPVTDIFKSFSLMDCLDPDEGAEWLLSCMAEFQKLPSPKLLIFDELLAASIELDMADKSFKALPKLKKFMAGIVAQGDSRSVWVWAMSQSPQCSDLGLNGGVRGNLRIIAIVSPKNKAAIQVITSTKLVPMIDGGMDALDQLMESSPCGRAVFDGKISRWLPMPTLENHSGFDRDNRSLNKEVAVKPQMIEAVKLTLSVDDKSETWQAIQPVANEKNDVPKIHPMIDKFNRIESLMDGKDSLPVREISRSLGCKSDEATQIAQMFCINQKSTYKFTQSSNTNGTVSKSIERI